MRKFCKCTNPLDPIATQNIFFCVDSTYFLGNPLKALQLACQDDQCGFFDTGVAEHGRESRYSLVVDTAWGCTVLVATLYTP